MQGLNELLDALLSCWPELRLQKLLRPASLGHRRLQVLSKQDGAESVTPRHSDKEVDDETPSWKFDQSQMSNNIIYNAVALLNDYRAHEGAIVAVFTMLDNILKYGKDDVRSSMGKQMLPNLLTLMRNHPSDDPNKHWREIHEKPKTAQDAGIGLLIDLLKFLGPSVGDKNRVVFAIISSMTHVDEYSVQVSAVKILYMMLRKWKVSSMRLIC